MKARLQNGSSGRVPALPEIGIEYHRIEVCTDDGRDPAAAEVVLTAEGNGFHIDIAAPSKPLAKVVIQWNVTLPEGTRILGDHWERGYGDLEWRRFVPDRVLPWYFLLYDPDTHTTLGCGVQTGAACLATWRVDQLGVALVLDTKNGNRGVTLGQRRLRAATVRTVASADGQSPLSTARALCAELCPKPHLPRFPVYGGNDWYYAYGKNSDESIRRDAALMREVSPNADNAPFMVIDAGWFESYGCNGGPYETGNAQFPGMSKLAEAMKRLAVRPGIWIRPLLTTAEVPARWRMPGAHPVWRQVNGNVLDPSLPEVLEHIRTDIARLRAWGYELIKHDFTTFDVSGRWGFEMMNDGAFSSGAWGFADRSRTTAEIISDLYRVIRTAADDAVLIGCNTIGHLGAGVFELQRTGDDTSGRDWGRTRKMGVNTLAFRMPQHNTFFAVDADCVGLTLDIPWALNAKWLDLLAHSGTPLFVSAAPDAVGPDQREALKAAFALAAVERQPAEPLDWFDTTCPRLWRCDGETRRYEWGDVGIE